MKKTIDYRGYRIKRSRDFGTRGNKGRGALVVTAPRFNTNVIPGGGWFQNVRDALLAIDCLHQLGDSPDTLLPDFDAQHWHRLYEDTKRGLKYDQERKVRPPS